MMNLHRFSVAAKGACAAAALLLLAACESTPEETGTAAAEGTSQQRAVGTTQAARPDVDTQQAYQEGSQEQLEAEIGNQVYFDFDKYDLKPEARATVERWADWLQRYPAVTVTIQGHADERGTREYNLGLGERRASSARNYLIALGVDPNRVATISYGKERPVCTEHNEQCWWRNRRDALVVN